MCKVMLIEDDPTMLALLQTLLEIEGFQVVRINHDRDPLSVIIEENPGLVLLDVHLKGSDGFSLLRRIRSSKEMEHVRVLMTSGMDFADECQREGADAFILKPFMPDELIHLVRDLTQS